MQCMSHPLFCVARRGTSKSMTQHRPKQETALARTEPHALRSVVSMAAAKVVREPDQGVAQSWADQTHVDIVPTASLASDAARNAQTVDGALQLYVRPGERVVGFGHGGSESLTMFLRIAEGPTFVRKILSERLVTPRWDGAGQDVMLAPCRKARSQTEYLRSLPASARPLFPRVFSILERDQVVAHDNVRSIYRELIYDMSYVPGIEVSRFIARYRPSPDVVAVLYREIFRLVRDKIHSQRRRKPVRPTLEQSYFGKIEKRLELSSQTAPQTFDERLLAAETIVINGQHLDNVPRLLRRFRASPVYQEALEPTFHSLVMGDTNTENIKIGNIEPLLRAYPQISVDHPPFSAEELELAFLDPRAIGFHEHGVDTGADDPMYDNKPWHNSLGNYDAIHGEHFELEHSVAEGTPGLVIRFHDDHPYRKSYQGIGRYFAPVMRAAWHLDDDASDVARNDPYWLVRFVFVMGTHFMAMPPFHFSRTPEGVLIDDPQHQKRPLAIYAEGIKWLNLALDMLEGRVRHFLGVPVTLPAELKKKREGTVLR
jgi:hypothetical protein